MTQIEILEELKKLTIPERLTIVEAVLHLIHEDLQQGEAANDSDQEKTPIGCSG